MIIANVRSALAGALADALDIHSYNYVPDTPLSPAAFVYPESYQHPPVFGAGADPIFIVRLLVSSTASENGQDQIDTLISTSGDGSAVVAIEADNTLGGVVNGCQVTDLRNYGVVTLGDGARYFSAELVVWVLDADTDLPVLMTETGTPIFVV